MPETRRVLGTEPEVGLYRHKMTKGAPWQYCRIMMESGRWVVLMNGEPVKGSGAIDPFDIPFLLYNWPLHPITEAEYAALVRQHANAPAGHPLRTPEQAVDLRAAAPLYKGKSS